MDVDDLRHVLRIAAAAGMRTVRVRLDEGEFSATLPLYQAPSSPADDEAEPLERFAEITAPVVGYLSYAEPPLEVGDEVEKGQVVAEIAALGLANDVLSPVSGTVVEILADDGEALEYGRPIARVKVR